MIKTEFVILALGVIDRLRKESDIAETDLEKLYCHHIAEVLGEYMGLPQAITHQIMSKG